MEEPISQIQWPRRVVSLCAALCTVAITSSCVGSSRGPVEIDSFDTEDGGRVLILAVQSCQGEPEADVVEESPDQVRIRVVSTTPGPLEGGADCLDGARIRLGEPLDDRCVIDDTTAESVPASPPQVGAGC